MSWKRARPSKADVMMVDRVLSLDCLCTCHRAGERPHAKGRCECKIRRALAGR